MAEQFRFSNVDQARKEVEPDPAQQRLHLLLAAGYMAAAGMPGCAASILLAIERMKPDEPLEVIGWREQIPDCSEAAR